MKKFKKLFAVILSLAMVLGMSMTAFATTAQNITTGNLKGTTPSNQDAMKVQISGVEGTVTYTAYKIIEPKYSNGGFTGYQWVNGTGKTGDVAFNTSGKPEGLTNDFITNLAKDTSSLTGVSFTPNQTEMTVGTWMVIVTPTNDNKTVYNPMVVSVYYQVGGIASETVNADDDWKLATEGAYAKSTDITNTVDKEIVNTSDKNAAVGDVIQFKLKGLIPSYSGQYKSATYTLTDTIVRGLEYVIDVDHPVEVKVGGTKVDKDVEYEQTNTPATTLSIAFKQDYLLKAETAALDNRNVEITYYARVTAGAEESAGENKVKLTYTNKPDSIDDSQEKTVYTYTFGFDGVLEKVAENEQGAVLPGAVFGLYKTNNNGTLSDQVGADFTTGNDGKITFKGLDADVMYYLKEKAAPAGYTVNETIYTVTFENVKYNNATATYDVKVAGTNGDTFTANGLTYGQQATTRAGVVVNTTISSLPSTGGIGTTIFTIGGCVIMIAAAALFFANRRRAAK